MLRSNVALAACALGVAAMCGLTSKANGAFLLSTTIDISGQFGEGAFGIDFNRAFNEVYLVRGNKLEVYDLGFNHLRSVTLSGTAIGNPEGIVRDPLTGDFFVTTELSPGNINRFSSAGNFVSSFSALSYTNGLAYRPSSQTLLAASLYGVDFGQYSMAGTTVSSFDSPFTHSAVGLAYDPVTDTVFIGENGSDEVHEYELSGDHLGIVIASGYAPPFNALGMSYDPYTASLYYVGQGGGVYVYHDASRATLTSAVTPEPASLALWGLGGLGFTVATAWRRRRAKTKQAS